MIQFFNINIIVKSVIGSITQNQNIIVKLQINTQSVLLVKVRLTSSFLSRRLPPVIFALTTDVTSLCVSEVLLLPYGLHFDDITRMENCRSRSTGKQAILACALDSVRSHTLALLKFSVRVFQMSSFVICIFYRKCRLQKYQSNQIAHSAVLFYESTLQIKIFEHP